MNEKDFRENILNQISEYYNKFHKDNKKFIPGKTKVSYAGRVYDEKEMMNLVDSAMDFWLSEGRFTRKFSKGLESFLGCKYALPVNSGSSANLVAISALKSEKLGDRKLNDGDEVITLSAGFPTTVTPILQNNLVPVYVDPEIGYYNPTVETLEKAISNKTKAMFLPHTLGIPFQVDEVAKLCKEKDIWLIEDNCDALGSKYNGKYTGTFGDISTLSFYPAHHITTGEGGAVITNNEQLKNILRSIRDWGKDCFCPSGKSNFCGSRFTGKHGDLPEGYDHKYIFSHLGYNLKMTEMQASIGVEQINKLPYFEKKRRENFDALYNGLKKYEDKLTLPKKFEGSDPSWFCFPITTENAKDLRNFLESKKIETRQLFAGNIIKQPAFNKTKYRISGNLKNTDYIMENTFFIGLYPGLLKKELEYIIDMFNEYFK